MSLFDIDVVSDTYRKDGDRSAVAKAAEGLKDSLKFFTEHASGIGPLSVLDVGCGAGEVTNAVRIAMARDDIRFVGVDPSAKQILNARKDYETVPNLAFAVARGDALPFDDGAFGIVYENSALCWALDPAAFIGEMLRVTRGIASFRVNVRDSRGESYACAFGFVKMIGSNVELMFNPADYGITQFIPNYLHRTATENVYQYPVWLQKVAWISADDVSRLVDLDSVEILLDKTNRTKDLVATRKTGHDGPPTLDDRFSVEMVTSRHIVARIA